VKPPETSFSGERVRRITGKGLEGERNRCNNNLEERYLRDQEKGQEKGKN